MSYDDPTRPLPPTDPRIPPPRPGAPLVSERVVVDGDLHWRQEIIDRLASLRTAVVLVAILAAAALGVGLWALVKADDNATSGRRAASAARVSALEQRVDALENRVGDLPTAGDIRDLSRAQRDLADRVAAAEKAARDAAQASGSNGQLRTAVQDLQTELQSFDKRIRALEQSAAQGTPTP